MTVQNSGTEHIEYKMLYIILGIFSASIGSWLDTYSLFWCQMGVEYYCLFLSPKGDKLILKEKFRFFPLQVASSSFQ